MIAECVVIVIILLIISVVFLRAKRVKWALLTFPLMVVPFANIAVSQIFRFLRYSYDANIITITNVVAVIISSAWIGLMSYYFEKKSQRASYLTTTLLFNIILAIILINNAPN